LKIADIALLRYLSLWNPQIVPVRVSFAGITTFTFHDLRHTFGTRLADAGVDVVKIKELMGHASIVTTMRYIHATDQGKRGAITVLSEYRQKQRHKFVTDEKTAGSSTCRKSLLIMVSRAGLEPATR